MKNLPSIVALEAKISCVNELLVLRHITAIIIKNVQRQHRQFNYLQTHIGGGSSGRRCENDLYHFKVENVNFCFAHLLAFTCVFRPTWPPTSV